MPVTYRLLGISGSIRTESYSTAILKAVAAASAPDASFDYADIGALPHFNQDICAGLFPAAVRHFSEQITQADGLVISSSEFNHGIPGVLKNAFDWASRPHNSSPLKRKPFLIVTSSPAFTGGVRAQYQIRETLVSALARPVSTPEIVVGMVGTKIIDGIFTDAMAMEFVRNGLVRMFEEIEILAKR